MQIQTQTSAANTSFSGRVHKPRGHRNRGNPVEPPTKEELRGGFDSSAKTIFKLNQRILDGKAVVSSQIKMVDVFFVS